VDSLRDIEPQPEQKDPSVARPDHLSESDGEAISLALDKLAERAKVARAEVAGASNENWETLWDFYLGRENHWKGYPGKLAPQYQFTNNRIGRNINIAHALLKEMHVSAEVQPREPGDEVGAALLDARKDYVLEKGWNKAAIGRAIQYMLILGSGWVQIRWDDELEDGVGDVRWEHWPTESVWFEPGCVEVDRARYVFTERRMDAAEAEHLYGLKDVTAAPPQEDEIGKREEGDRTGEHERAYNVAADSQPSTTTVLIPAAEFANLDRSQKEVIVQSWWIRSDDEKYKNGRHIVRVGKSIVVDEEYKYEHGRWPFVPFYDMVDPKTVYGDCAARQAIEPQIELNVIESIILMHTHLNTSAPLIWYPQSGISELILERQASKANGIIPCKHPGFKPERLRMPDLPSSVLECRTIQVKNIDDGMRIQEVIPPGSRGFPASGEVVRELRETQLVEIRAKASNVADGMQRGVEMTISLMQQYYAADRYIRIVGALPKFLEGLTDPETDEEIVYSPDETGEGTHFARMSPDNIKHGYDVMVREMTWEPLSKQANVDKFIKLYELDGGETMRISDLAELDPGGPTGKIIVRRMKAREAEMAQAPAEPAAPMEQPMPMPMPMPGQMMGGM